MPVFEPIQAGSNPLESFHSSRNPESTVPAPDSDMAMENFVLFTNERSTAPLSGPPAASAGRKKKATKYVNPIQHAAPKICTSRKPIIVRSTALASGIRPPWVDQ